MKFKSTGLGFKWRVVFFTIIVIFCGIGVFFNFGMTTESDVEEYQLLMAKSVETKASAKTASYNAKQEREEVVKQVVFSGTQERLQLRVFSQSSEFIVNQREDSSELVEHFKGVTCFMHEDLYTVDPDGQPMQCVRFLEAESATYDYKTDCFMAEKVKVMRFVLPGHEIPHSIKGLEPIMSGVADTVTFSMSDKNRNFKAERLKATFWNERDL